MRYIIILCQEEFVIKFKNALFLSLDVLIQAMYVLYQAYADFMYTVGHGKKQMKGCLAS